MRELPVGGWGIRGSWHGKSSKTQYQTHKIIILCCPNCACDSSLAQFTISEDGVVTPAYKCPHGCGYVGDLKLIGYGDFLRQCPPPPGS
jgi:hypothetical protein